MEDCIFCKIVKGEIPCYKVYEDKDFFGFLDIAPLNRGHVLLIPKKHNRWVWDVENFGKYWEAARKVAKMCMKGLNAKMVEFLTHGTDVPHAHILIVPIYNNEVFINTSNRLNLSSKEMQKIADVIAGR